MPDLVRYRSVPPGPRTAAVGGHDALMDSEWSSAAADRFAVHYEDVRGKVRSHVLHAHLKTHLPPGPATAVDVGGGTGEQAVLLSQAGYSVTVVDPSEAMLEHATTRIASEAPEVAERITLVHANGQQARHILKGARFDAVLCHGVLLYLDDPDPLVHELCELAKPGGVVSIVTKNARTLAMRPGLAGEWRNALSAFEAVTEVNALGLLTHGDTVERLAGVLQKSGVDSANWYGVRLFTEGWTGQPAPSDDMGDLLAAELEASRRDPYRQLSRLFHLVGIKR